MDMKSDEAAAVAFIQTPTSISSSECQECDANHSTRPRNILVYVKKNQVKTRVNEKLIYKKHLPMPDTSKQGLVLRRRAKTVISKRKHSKINKHNNNKKSKYKNGPGHEIVPHEERVGKQPITKVDLDERTLREWENSMEKLDRQGIVEETDESWEKERAKFHLRVKSFISTMQVIQGEMKFTEWKGSVLDSIVGAYLTQNVNDTMSSSAFISLAAAYPHRHSPAENVKLALNKTYSEKKEMNVVSRKRVLKRKTCEVDDIIHDTTIHWEALRKDHSKGGDCRNKAFDKPDAIDWEAVLMAKVGDVAKAIKKRGMGNNLAARIKNCLDILAKNLGSIDLEWIRDVPPLKAREYLLSIPGLGLKSVECIRLLTLKQKAFPIDTHAGRVAVRLGWVPIQKLPEGQEFHQLKEYPHANSVQKYLWPRLSNLDESTLYELHCQMITLGKVFCTKKYPNCTACPMRSKCKHYTSYLASGSSARLALQGLPALVETAVVPIECVFPKCPVEVEWDIEDFGVNRISRIKADDEDIQKFIDEKNVSLQEGEISKALMVLNTECVSIPASKLKNAAYTRTEHKVYELPDSHSVLAEFEKREAGDACPYLLATWTKENLDEDECNSNVYGTILIPIRTAMRGKFPLNATYFQANEVFVDDDSCEFPIKVSRATISGLSCATLYCGNNVSRICKGMKSHEVKKCFRKGYICLRRFNRETRETKPLSARFYFPKVK
ncbi:hypothetical protein CASFOL_001698 [Castilleja foliolosa]|uniref:HhH-GPD domain-containing protein n=1 Tax=Castilleja foliolosa TaxID=1961234 RepID=A0ABD3ECJ1_9LAMI